MRMGLEADGLEEQKTMSGSTSVIQEQKAEGIGSTDLPRSTSLKLEEPSPIVFNGWVGFRCQRNESMDKPIEGWWGWCNSVGKVFSVHFRPVDQANQSRLERHMRSLLINWDCLETV